MFGPSVLLANTMSLATKIDEVRSVILDLKPNLGFFTETWLKDTVRDSHLCIPGYSFIYRNRTTDHHGGVGLYIQNSIKFKRLDNLLDPDIEALWAWLRPSRLPRGALVLLRALYTIHTLTTATETRHLQTICLRPSRPWKESTPVAVSCYAEISIA